jgi:hypothetical protein
MAEVYKVTLAVTVTKASDGSTIQADEVYFTDQTFSKMVSKANQFYELVAKLQKEK